MSQIAELPPEVPSADWQPAGARQRLGVFTRFGEIFSLIFRHRPGLFLGTTLAATVVARALSSAIVLGLVSFIPTPAGRREIAPWIGLGTLAVDALVWLLALGVMISAGGDALAGRRRPLSAYASIALRRMVPALVLGFVAALLALLSSALIVLFGLWVAANLAVFLPALYCDSAGWGALGRSRRLTKGYRWPIVGLLLLATLAASLVIVLLATVVVALALPGRQQAFAFMIILQVIALPLAAAAPTVLHARLRALKEGPDRQDLASIFG